MQQTVGNTPTARWHFALIARTPRARRTPTLHEWAERSQKPWGQPHDCCPNHEHQQHCANHQHGHGCTERPVLGTAELRCDHRADHVAFGAAEHRGCHIVATHRDERQQHAGRNTRASEWQSHTEKCGKSPSAKVFTCFA